MNITLQNGALNIKTLDSTMPQRLPNVWLVTGYRAGESTQIIALAEALGWPFEVKRIAYKNYDFVPGLLRAISLSGINKIQSSPLTPPWPDLVISAGMRNEPICRWIKQQANKTLRIVHIGRPWAGLDHFDLVITTPQYRLPSPPNVLHNTLTLHRVTDKRLAQKQKDWASRFTHLPRPFTAVIIGGNSGPYTFGTIAAKRLGEQASMMAQATGGTLLITTSARTSQASTNALAETITVPNHLYRWTPDTSENPYYAFLALADSLIVTGDSISMLSEACATRKPVYIFDLGTGSHAMRTHSSNTVHDPEEASNNDFRIGGLLYRIIMHLGPQRLSREITLVHKKLVDQGRAVWLGESLLKHTQLSPLEDINRAVEKTQRLFNLD